ncbi:MAG: hypothetical protein AAGI30_05485 [Planctomycetota bacterium]
MLNHHRVASRIAAGALRWPLTRIRDVCARAIRPQFALRRDVEAEVAEHFGQLLADELERGAARNAYEHVITRFGAPEKVVRRTLRSTLAPIFAARATAILLLVSLFLGLAAVPTPDTPAGAFIATRFGIERTGARTLMVRHEGAWWRVISIQGVAGKELVTRSAEHYGSRTLEMLNHNLAGVLATCGIEAGNSIRAKLQYRGTIYDGQFPLTPDTLEQSRHYFDTRHSQLATAQ